MPRLCPASDLGVRLTERYIQISGSRRMISMTENPILMSKAFAMHALGA